MANKVKWVVAIGLWLFIAYSLIGPFVTYRTYDIKICHVTGSTLTHRTFLGRAQLPERIVTDLEKWILLRDPDFQPNWRHLSRAEIQILGESHACGKAPVIHGFRPYLKDMLACMKDDEIAELVKVLRTGDKAAQRALLNRHFDTAL